MYMLNNEFLISYSLKKTDLGESKEHWHNKHTAIHCDYQLQINMSVLPISHVTDKIKPKLKSKLMSFHTIFNKIYVDINVI